MNPAQTLTAAAVRLREAAQEAIHEDRPVWRLGNTLGTKTKVVLDDPDKPSVLIETYAARLERVNRYLTMVGPNVGLALADWLEAVAAEHPYDVFPERGPCGPDCDGHEAFVMCRRCSFDGPCKPVQPALTVARQILGVAE